MQSQNAAQNVLAQHASAVAPSAPREYVPHAPENWYVDPVRLGVPGVRQPERPGQPDDNPLAWQTDSLCAQTDPEAFFPEKGGSTRDAKKICSSCEVRVHCLEYALENDERFGIWGGLSERERRKLRKRA
jgi:WhiB family redox-sensing transcriptional regulator